MYYNIYFFLFNVVLCQRETGTRRKLQGSSRTKKLIRQSRKSLLGAGRLKKKKDKKKIKKSFNSLDYRRDSGGNRKHFTETRWQHGSKHMYSQKSFEKKWMEDLNWLTLETNKRNHACWTKAYKEEIIFSLWVVEFHVKNNKVNLATFFVCGFVERDKKKNFCLPGNYHYLFIIWFWG